MSSHPSFANLSLEHAIAPLKLAAHSADHIKQALKELDTQFISEFGTEIALNSLLTSTEPFPRLFELTLCYGTWAPLLRGWIVKTFPTSRSSFLDSVHKTVLDRISLCFPFLPIPFSRDGSDVIREWRAEVQKAIEVLQALGSLTFEMDDPEELESFPFGVKQKQSKRKKKGKKPPTPAVALNPKDLERFEVGFPENESDVAELLELMLATMKLSFQRYMIMLDEEYVWKAIVDMSVISVESDEPKKDPKTKEPVVDDAEPAETPIPAAYPMVQPMKAALYFDSAEGLGEWRILISTRADRDLRDWRRRDAEFFKIIIKKIRELSNGHFSADNQKRLNKSEVEFAIFEAKMTRDTRLIYHIDCVPEYDNNKYERQVIKIFGVYTHAQIDKRLWDSMGYQLARKGKQYRDRCKFRNRPFHRRDSVYTPASFPPVEVEEKDDLIIPELPKEDLEEIHSLLVLEKFVMLSQELLNSILADLDVAHVFSVTPQEKEIIEHPYSCYVLGRSGTGKTTTMLFKMLGIERAYGLKTDASTAKPRQIFVTQSRVLATRVEEYFAKLLDSLAAAKKSKKELNAIAKERKAQQDENVTFLYDVDDDVNWKAGLPPKYSLLQDEHFPLFLTFERLAQLLEGDMHGVQPQPASKLPNGKGCIITYEVFVEQYWPHFPQNLTKNLDPPLVFSELLGVIEGSEPSLSHASRYLDQKAYEGLSHRTQHVFVKQRDTIYALFLAYLKRKRQNNDQDVADRTHKILQAFESSGVPGSKIDYIYVDEAQDNLLIDAMLLRSLCRNPDGLFWAGDTAQTIALGSSFRFDDLKAFLYRLEKRREGKLADDQKGTQGDLRTFQLAINYRSHGGIVRCAHTVIELITHFWPYAIDSMAPEQGIVDGAKPVFFSGWDTNTVRYEQFLFGDSGDRIEFGARQCILVRDEAAKTELRKQVGDIGLILTLYESKGLEFDDVLLYKFFEDSVVDLGQWRVVLNLIGKSPQSATGSVTSAPRFDETRHAGVCSELKFLYVAITRARKNLWIVDCSDKAEPMKALWVARDYIQSCTPGTELPNLAVSSTPEEWAKTGHSLFTNRRYLQAMHAFKRAGLEREVKIAHTHYLREEARSIQATNKETTLAKQTAFIVAAESFLECADVSKGKGRRVYFHNAADCFDRAAQFFDTAEHFSRAAHAYEEAEEFNDALRLYRKCDKFDEAVNIVTSQRKVLDPVLVESVVDVARLFYFKQRELKKVQRLFESVEEQLEYLEENVLLDECHAAVLVELGRYQEAADVHLAEGRTLEAIQVLLQNSTSAESTRRANACILQGLWQSVSFAVRITKDNDKAREMLDLASKLNTSILSTSEQDEVSMFRSIKALDFKTLRQLGYRFVERNEKVQALLCFDHCFMAPVNFTGLDNVAISNVLEGFYTYCTLLREISLNLNLNKAGIRRLFGLQEATSENMLHVPRGTWAHKLLSDARLLVLQFEEESPIVSNQTILGTLRSQLWKRLARRLQEESDSCRRSKVFAPCLSFIMNEQCKLIQCSRQHIPYTDLTQGWFTAQLRLYFQQIMIVHVLHSIPNDSGSMESRFKEHRYWIRRLFDTFFPSVHYLGSFSTLRLDLIPESQRALETVKHWCQNILSTRPGSSRPDILTFTLIYEASALCLTIDKYEAPRYIHRGPFLRSFEKSTLYHRNSKTGSIYIIPELLQALQASDTSFVSAGVLVLRQIFTNKIPLEINVVRHLVEFLAGAVIMVKVHFNLHCVTLPRSWFLSLLHHISKRENVDTRLIDQFVACVGHLIQVIVTGESSAAHLVHEGRPLPDLPPVLRQLYIAPFCRVLGFLGWNIFNSKLRGDILGRFKPLQTANYHWSYDKFAKARIWNHVVEALFDPHSHSSLDDLVQLVRESEQISRPPPLSVTRVTFKSVDDIRRSLASHASATSMLSSLRPEAPTFVPRSKQEEPQIPKDEQANALVTNEVQVEEVADRPDADITDVVDSRTLIDTIANTAPQVPRDVISPAQFAVALKLLKGYRRRVMQRNLANKKAPIESSCEVIYENCLRFSAEMDWPYRFYYKKLYLGLVPHLVVCVNVVQTFAQGAKVKAKKRLLKDNEDLDELNKKMTELNIIFKLSRSLHIQLDPQSQVHKQRDLDELKRLVGQVEELVNRVPGSGVAEVRPHLDLSIKAIVREKQPPKVLEKPRLNMGEDDDETYMQPDPESPPVQPCL